MRLRLASARRIEMKTEWDVESAIATYNVDRWGGGYFTINSSGNVEARPLQEYGGPTDIHEDGSRSELVAALATHKELESLIVCNGYHDRAFIRIELLGRELGKSVIIVVKKLE